MVEDAVVAKNAVEVPAVSESVPRVERPVTPSVPEKVAVVPVSAPRLALVE